MGKTIDATINFMKATKNTTNAARIAGFAGMLNVIRSKLSDLSRQGLDRAVADLYEDTDLFRYATCNDLVSLMARYPQYCRVDRDSDKSHAWGLKSMGTLFCSDRLARFKPARVLEVGAGWGTHFDTHFGAELEYWMIDEASDIGGSESSKAKFEKGIAERRHTHFVRGLLGSFLPDLEDDSFDMVFSISVIEHVPPEYKRKFYEDMFRVLKPGGMIVHSIDVTDDTLGRAEFEVIRQAGFQLPNRPDLRIRVKPADGNPTLFEDLWTVYHGYLGLNRPDKWTSPKRILGHVTTILVQGQKPESG